jgi:hypothetical protein
MANKKISQLTPKGSALAGTDLLEVSVFNGVTYDTKSLTGANVVSGLQPTLFSGTNIKTINSTSLLGSGDIVISTGLTVGTTPIASGTVGRVLFEGTGNVLQEDAKLFWDNTNKKLGIGATPDVNTVLDVRSAGTLATDLAFRVRNSANTANIVTIQGDGAFTVGTYTNPNTKLSVTGTTLGAYITGNTGIYAQSNITSGTLYAIDCLGRALSGANTSYGIRAQSDTSGVGSTNYGGRFFAYNGTTNYAGYFDAYGGTNNYALVTQRGFSGFNKIDPSAIVDIKAAGALSTDIALRVRNSSNSADLFSVQGDGKYSINDGGGVTTNAFSYISDGRLFMAKSGGNFIEMNNSGQNRIYNPTGGFEIAGNITFTTQAVSGSGGSTPFYIYAGTLQIGALVATGGASNCVWMSNGVAPTLTYADRHWYYSADITAGNAAPHFRTENGAVVKIYQETTAVTSATVVSGSGGVVKHDDTFDGYTLEKVVRALRNQGLLQ